MTLDASAPAGPSHAEAPPLPCPGDLTPSQAQDVLARVTWRLVPLLFVCYVIAYIDRINVGFAKLYLRDTLGVDVTVYGSVYGLGAGLFFIGYFLFEVPSNLFLQRVGARLWIARIMIVWGLVSMSMTLVTGVASFYVLRFLLGAAEAGFFPGVLFYLTGWFPAETRARTIALFATGGVMAGVVGSPLSGAILGFDGVAGLAGWQWLFLLEAIPAILMGIVVLLVLPDAPRQAHWLSDAEKGWIEARLGEESARTGRQRPRHLREMFASRRIWLLCLLYSLLNVGSYGYEMWLPSIVKGFSGRSDLVVGLINTFPYLAAGAVMLLVGRYSDRTGKRRGPVAAAAVVSAAGFAVSAYVSNPYLAMVGLTLAFIGIKSTLGPFWAMGTSLLTGTAAAGGIALINSVGNLGGFVGPYVVGLIKDRTEGDLAALLFLGSSLLCMGVLALRLRTPDPG